MLYFMQANIIIIIKLILFKSNSILTRACMHERAQSKMLVLITSKLSNVALILSVNNNNKCHAYKCCTFRSGSILVKTKLVLYLNNIQSPHVVLTSNGNYFHLRFFNNFPNSIKYTDHLLRPATG